MSHVDTQVRDAVGFITLDRPQALNALSLPMIRDLTAVLLSWRDDPAVRAVALRGMSKQGPFGAFCAGGDIRFFHAAALAGDPALEDFFTEEYRLNHLIHRYPKPTVVFMDGIVMGGGMGLAQGCTLRVATTRTKMAMPETLIGLFPDVGGGYFLSRCPGHVGEFLALTGEHLDGHQAVQASLADVVVDPVGLTSLWEQLPQRLNPAAASDWTRLARQWPEALLDTHPKGWPPELESVFSAPDLNTALVHLNQLSAQGSSWASHQLQALSKRSPLMLHVTWAQIRKARGMALADELRMERDLVRHCFHPQHLSRSTAQSDTVEGIRALAVDKDHHPHWMHDSLEAVTQAQVAPFFQSPWPAHAHPLHHLKD